MKPFDDPKRIVAAGYDQIAGRYLAWSGGNPDDPRMRSAALLLDSLAPGADVLELGCGAGGPTTQTLAKHFNLTGVDISAESVRLARLAIPGATLIQADMGSLDFPAASFDAVVAFYSIIHLPREEHAALFRSIARWLRPGGLFVATLGVSETEDGYEADWLGAPMYWSHYESATNQRLITEAGLHIISAREETTDEDGSPVTFLWVVARRGVPTPGANP